MFDALKTIAQARAAVGAGRNAEAVRLLAELEGHPFREVHAARVALLTIAGEPAAAIAVARRHALENDPDLALTLGIAHEAVGNKAEALRYLAATNPTGPLALRTKHLAHDLANRGASLPADVMLPRDDARAIAPDHEALRVGDIDAWRAVALPVFDAMPEFLVGARELAWLGGRLRRWTGERVGHLAVMLDGGSGDALLFGRYLDRVAGFADRVTVHGPAPVMPLLAERFPALRFVWGSDLPRDIGAADAYVHALGLVDAFGMVAAEYLEATPIEREPDGMRHVGVCWRGSRANPLDHLRSVDPADLAPLLELPGIVWHSLTVPAQALPGMVEHAHELRDFRDTARLVRSLDLVVTVDSAVANLCGAMGRPDIVLLEHEPEWRWGTGEPSPWFPTLRQVRQEAAGEWRGVLEQVCGMLAPD
jgi:hypothetical protein